MRTIFLVVFLLLTAHCSLLTAEAQLQQSGGAGSALTSITLGGNVLTAQATGELNTNLGRVGGNTVATGNGTSSTGTQRVTIASDNTAFTVNAAQSGTWTVQPGNTANTTAWLVTGTGGVFPSTQSGTWTVQPGNTANTTAWLMKTVPSNSCGTTVFNQAWGAVPTSNTAVTATTTCKAVLVFTNTNASAQTVSVTDGQGSPVTAIGPAFSIPGLSTVRFEMEGALTTGIKWIAGGTGVNGSVVGFQ